MNRHPAISATSAVASREAASAIDHLGNEAGGGSGNQRSQSRNEGALRFVGGDDGAQHGTAAV